VSAISIRRRRIRVSLDLARELVVRELKLRYRRTTVGLAWSFAFPVGQVVVLSFVFTVVLPTRINKYSAFVSIGVLVWTWFQSSLVMASTAITGNRELVRRPGFPSAVLPLSTVATNLALFLMAFPAMVVVVLWSGGQPGVGIVVLPFVMAVQYLLTLGIAYFVASLNVRFRDTQQLVALLLLLFFFVTPIFYDAASVPATYRWLYDLNPLVVLLDSYRAALLHGEFPHLSHLFAVAAASVLIVLAGYRLFERSSTRFAEEI
jgi:lipopolysaccharide transport system permease protein